MLFIDLGFVDPIRGHRLLYFPGGRVPRTAFLDAGLCCDQRFRVAGQRHHGEGALVHFVVQNKLLRLLARSRVQHIRGKPVFQPVSPGGLVEGNQVIVGAVGIDDFCSEPLALRDRRERRLGRAAPPVCGRNLRPQQQEEFAGVGRQVNLERLLVLQQKSRFRNIHDLGNAKHDPVGLHQCMGEQVGGFIVLRNIERTCLQPRRQGCQTAGAAFLCRLESETALVELPGRTAVP